MASPKLQEIAAYIQEVEDKAASSEKERDAAVIQLNSMKDERKVLVGALTKIQTLVNNLLSAVTPEKESK